MSLRLVTKRDLSRFTRVAMAGMELDPVFPYRYPKRHEYPVECFAFLRARYAGIIASSTNTVVAYIDPATDELVAWAVWEIPPQHHAQFVASLPPCTDADQEDLEAVDLSGLEPLHLNQPRIDAFMGSMEISRQALFDGPLGGAQNHLYLAILCVHPAYHRKGIGRMMVQWGIDHARAAGLGVVTLYASPMGKRLYGSMGFETVGEFRMQAPGEDEFIDLPGMMLKL